MALLEAFFELRDTYNKTWASPPLAKQKSACSFELRLTTYLPTWNPNGMFYHCPIKVSKTLRTRFGHNSRAKDCMLSPSLQVVWERDDAKPVSPSCRSRRTPDVLLLCYRQAEKRLPFAVNKIGISWTERLLYFKTSISAPFEFLNC